MDANEEIKKPVPKSATYGAMEIILLLSGLVGVLIGLLHLTALLLLDFSPLRLADTAFNLTLGLLILICWRLLRARKGKAILVFFSALLLNIAYPLLVDRGFNFIAAGFGAIILLQLVVFRRSGEL